jgi:SAM-dependent methyltransferase
LKQIRQRRDWEDLAAFDPWSAILREPGRVRAWNVDDFLATGKRDAERALADAAAHGLPSSRRRALDFGCGVGRVTRVLADRFDDVLGLDISPTMVARARELDGAAARVRYRVGAQAELDVLPAEDFDFVVSLLVLQHLPSPEDVEEAVRALTRRVAVGGALVLQVPSELPPRRRIQSRRRAYAALRGLGLPAPVLLGRLSLDPIRTTAVSEKRLAAAVENAGGTVLSSQADDASGPHVPSRRYVVTRASIDRDAK